jgi:hypothetical protein
MWGRHNRWTGEGSLDSMVSGGIFFALRYSKRPLTTLYEETATRPLE